MDTGEKIEAAFKNPETILAAIRVGVFDAARLHSAFGVPMVSWEDGKIVLVDPEDVLRIEKKQPTRATAGH